LGCSGVLVRREITQKGAHLLGAHFFGVTFPMEQDEALNPVHLYLFRAQPIMLKTDRIADTVEQFELAVAACPWNARRHALFYAGLPRKRKK